MEIVTLTAADLERLIKSAVYEGVDNALAKREAPVDPDSLLTAKQAAALLGMTENAFRVADSRGKYQSLVQADGVSVRWRKRDILATWTPAE